MLTKLITLAFEEGLEFLKLERMNAEQELQLLGCAYGILFLSQLAERNPAEMKVVHEFLARCHKRIGDATYAKKHQYMAQRWSV